MNAEKEVSIRYSKLAQDSCCLSCGGAINYSEVKPGEVCVDLGSGRGNDAIRLAEKTGNTGYVYGVDISEGMIDKAKKTAENLGVKNVDFLKAPLENIPLKNDTVDLIISNCTLNHADNKPAVWKEIYRILKRGGRFVVSDIYSLGEVPEQYRNDPAAVAECWAGAIPRDKYMDILKYAGFNNVTIIEESKPYEKGKIQVASITFAATKQAGCCCC